MSTEEAPLLPEYVVGAAAVSSSGDPEPSMLPASFSFKDYLAGVDAAVSAGKLGGLSGKAPVPIKTGGFDDTRNDVDADGKYLLLGVPEWRPGMSSYLRLGAACSTWDTALGNELEKIIHLTGIVGKATNLPFEDDERNRGQADVHPGVGATVDDSALLHEKGGWRDHSDGNRITTTYGDKIEIIRGGWKMVVMGRQDTPLESAGWDLSGQFVQDWGYSRPGASVILQWLPIYGDVVDATGTWLQRDSSEIFHLWSRTAGNKRDDYWGDLLESYIGIETPGTSVAQSPAWRGREMNPSLKVNPDIIKKTFALSITSQKGSPIRPVPTITEDTYVTTRVSSTTADSITGTTTVTGAITGTKKAGSTSSTTTVSGDLSETLNVGGAVTETTTVGGAMTSVSTVAGAITEVTTAGVITEATTSVAQTDIAITGVAVDVTAAARRTDIFVGGLDIDLYAALLKIDVSFAFAVDVNLSAKAKYTLFGALEVDWGPEVELSLIDAQIALAYDVRTPLFEVRSLLTYIGPLVFLGLAPVGGNPADGGVAAIAAG